MASSLRWDLDLEFLNSIGTDKYYGDFRIWPIALYIMRQPWANGTRSKDSAFEVICLDVKLTMGNAVMFKLHC